jgi:Uri superfamily endonuclease
MFGPGGLVPDKKTSEEEKKHWHIDYLLNHMQIEAVYVLPGKNLESQLSRKAVQRYSHVQGFGCSDKRSDRVQLIHLKNRGVTRKFIRLLVSAGFRKNENMSN